MCVSVQAVGGTVQYEELAGFQKGLECLFS